jgi:hypothetical protein
MDAEEARQRGEDYDPIKAAMENTEYVFVGRAMNTMKNVFDSIDAESYTMEVTASFVVTETIKGPSNEKVIIVSGRPPNSCSCIYDFETGVEYLVFANKVGDKYFTFRCELIRPKDMSEYESVKKFKS